MHTLWVSCRIQKRHDCGTHCARCADGEGMRHSDSPAVSETGGRIAGPDVVSRRSLPREEVGESDDRAEGTVTMMVVIATASRWRSIVEIRHRGQRQLMSYSGVRQIS